MHTYMYLHNYVEFIVKWTCTETECILPTGLTMNYTNGEVFCAARDAHLVTIESDEKYTLVQESIWENEYLYFLGYKYYNQADKWLNYDGTEPTMPGTSMIHQCF